jgi:hypothetical protein
MDNYIDELSKLYVRRDAKKLKEKLEVFKNAGWTYNPDTGELLSHRKTPIKNTSCKVFVDNKATSALKHQICYYLHTGLIPFYLIHIDGDNNNNRISNLIESQYLQKEKQKKAQSYNKEYVSPKKYLKDTEFTYEIIISKGKGKLTPKAQEMTLKLVDELSKKFTYHDVSDSYDCKQEALLDILNGWHHFDERRYNSAFSYITEIAKRGMAKGFGKITGKSFSSKITPKIVRFNNW